MPRTRPLSALAARDRLIVALDQDSAADARALVRDLGDAVSFYKVGWVTLVVTGIGIVEELRGLGKQVFLDLKLFDVPNTVREAMARVTRLGVRFATVHGNRENIAAAVAGRAAAIHAGAEGGLQILAVTALTSLAEHDVRQMYSLPATVSLEEHVVHVARRMVEAGCDGVIASPREIARIRSIFPDTVLIVTPGIRLAGESVDDHKRPGTPADSIRAGADYLVVGRSIYQDSDPRRKAAAYVQEIEKGLAGRGVSG